VQVIVYAARGDERFLGLLKNKFQKKKTSIKGARARAAGRAYSSNRVNHTIYAFIFSFISLKCGDLSSNKFFLVFKLTRRYLYICVRFKNFRSLNNNIVSNLVCRIYCSVNENKVY